MLDFYITQIKILFLKTIKQHKTLTSLTATTVSGTTGYVFLVRKSEQDTYSKKPPSINDSIINELKNNSIELRLKRIQTMNLRLLT